MSSVLKLLDSTKYVLCIGYLKILKKERTHNEVTKRVSISQLTQGLSVLKTNRLMMTPALYDMPPFRLVSIKPSRRNTPSPPPTANLQTSNPDSLIESNEKLVLRNR